MNALGIDVGSSNVKAVLLDPEGRLLAHSSGPLTTVHEGDAVTQDPKELWSTLARVITEITAADPAAASAIGDLAVCSQYSSIVPVDGDGVPVGPIVMYMDRRGTDLCWQIMERHPEAFEIFVERHGIPPIGAGLSLSHMLALEASEPEVAAATATYLEVMDFVNLLLTGRAAATQATMFASQLCDNRVVGTTRYDDTLVTLAGIDRSRLPELIELGSTVGTVRRSVALKLGLPEGVRVHAGINDTQAAALATGVLTNGPSGTATGERGHTVGMAIGTTAVVLDAAAEHKVDLDQEVLSMPAPFAGQRLVMAENGVAGRSVEHFFSLMGLDPFQGDGVDAALQASPPGAAGLLFLPWLDGSMAPCADGSVRGGLIGLSLTTTRHDLVRSALEGTALNLAWLLPAVEGLTGEPAERIVFVGGAGRSRGWAQVLADVTQLPVDVASHPELAAAIATARYALARSGNGAPPDFVADIAVSLTPNASTAARYREIQEQFQAAFSMSRGICEALGHG